MCGLQTLVEPSIAVGILRWILGTRLSFFLTCWVLFYCPICDPLIISMLFFRLFGIGHGMSWYHMTFLLASSMYMTKQDRNCTMLGIPWWVSLNYSCTSSRIFFLKSKGDTEFGNSLQGTLIALAAFSQNQLLSMSRSAVLLSPIAYVGQMTSPLARNAADNFIAEVKTYSLSFMFDFQQNKILWPYTLSFLTVLVLVGSWWIRSKRVRKQLFFFTLPIILMLQAKQFYFCC